MTPLGAPRPWILEEPIDPKEGILTHAEGIHIPYFIY